MPISNSAQVVLDSNFLISLLDRDDVHHKRAKRIYTDLEDDGATVFLSDVLINEVTSVIARRYESKGMQARFAKWLDSFKAKIEGLDILCLYDLMPVHLPDILSIMAAHKSCFNFHDALFIFLLREIPKVSFVTFDKDFEMLADTLKGTSNNL